MRLAVTCTLLWAVSLLPGAEAEPANYASRAMGGTVQGPSNSSAYSHQPPIANDGDFRSFAWAYLDTPTIVRFSEPRTINTVEVLLYESTTRWYRFRVEVSMDGESWREVASRTEGFPRGWQTVTFDAVKCGQVKLTFTATSVETRSYHIVEVAAFLLDDPSQPSPLRKAYDQREVRRRQTSREILLRYLGDNAAMTPEEVKEALAQDGKPVPRDLDGDGDPDLADFVDKDSKHTVHPMLVRVIDDDDDMTADGSGDLDSDLYIADWHGDGSIDRAVDYWDFDADGDADRMDIYYPPDTWHGSDVELVVIRDIGDDNRMWYTRNYEYQQRPCQWNSDFNGDEAFCMFYYNRDAEQFVPHLEAPFTHHDLDGDGVSELTIQFLGHAARIHTIRFSFDADNDSNPLRRRRDYDFAFNCRGELVVPAEKSTTDVLRTGEHTQPWLDWPYARELAESGNWQSCNLCWDEIDHNVNPASRDERDHERWEGVGGYPMLEGNKRWETDQDYSGKMKLYYWPADRRLHLLGAETGYINVDYDHDYRIDAKLEYRDEDGDGFFDYWSYDSNGDGKPEHEVRPPKSEPQIVPIEYDKFTNRYRAWVNHALQANEALTSRLRALVGAEEKVAAEDWWNGERLTGFYAGDKLGKSAEARRYYQDVIREELFLHARREFGKSDWWPAFQAAYEAGAFEDATGILADH